MAMAIAAAMAGSRIESQQQRAKLDIAFTIIFCALCRAAHARRRLILSLCQRMGCAIMNSRQLTAALGLCASILTLSACGSAEPPATPPLAGARIGGPIALTDQNGQPFTDAALSGRYRLIYFGYSFCPDVCPVDLNWLMLGLRQFERQHPDRAAQIQPIFITVDPGRDTPEVVRNFVAQFHPRLIGLTGSDTDIARVAAQFLVRYERVDGSTPDAYLVSHTQLAYLMGPSGEPIALIPTDQINTPDVNEGSPDLVASQLAAWVR